MKNSLEKVSNKLKSDFYLFFQMYWDKISSDKLIESNHIKFICDELQKIGFQILNNDDCDFDWCIINVPPGSSKSSICSIAFPCWILANDSSKFIINTSYSDTLATGFIRKSKMILQSDSFSDLFGKLELTKDNEGYMETKSGGGRFATSTGGTITGSHSNLIIVDDPLSVEQSYSQAHIDRANRYLTETIPSRVRDKKKVPKILIMQRLNENDPTGYILNSGLKVKHICLPSELTDYTTNPELYTNGVLDEVRMGHDVLEKYKNFAYSYASQFLQSPSPLEGGIIKKEWFVIDKINSIGRKTILIDGAYTNNKSNDPTGILITEFRNGKTYILNYIREWLTISELLDKMPYIFEANGITQRDEILIEPKASGKDLVSMFRKFFNIPTNELKGDFIKFSKRERIETAAPFVQQGSFILNKAEWNEQFINELCMFPNAKHDEAVDLLSYACEINYLQKKFGFMLNC